MTNLIHHETAACYLGIACYNRSRRPYPKSFASRQCCPPLSDYFLGAMREASFFLPNSPRFSNKLSALRNTLLAE